MTWTPIRSAISATCGRLAFAKGGAPISRLTFGLDAFDLFFDDPKVQKLLTELGCDRRAVRLDAFGARLA
jgi:hypothetical protein